MVDAILDSAGQKGTGRWTAIEALHLGAPASTIEAAVGARNLSALVEDRATGAALFGGPGRIAGDAGEVGKRDAETFGDPARRKKRGRSVREAAGCIVQNCGWHERDPIMN